MDCAVCQDNFEKFWCAVNTHPCGTIDKVLDEILPLISSITSEKSSATISLQQALPRIIQAASLGFPCKKMCEDVMDSCGCAQQPTFAEAMDAIQAGGNLNATVTMGLSTKELFHLIWDKHVCDLFSEESFPGFSGLCVSSYQTSLKFQLSGYAPIEGTDIQKLNHSRGGFSSCILSQPVDKNNWDH